MEQTNRACFWKGKERKGDKHCFKHAPSIKGGLFGIEKNHRRSSGFKSGGKLKDRLPPSNNEAEKALLGCLLLSPREQLWEFVSSFANCEKYFFDLRHSQIFEAVRDLANAGKHVDSITIHAELQKRKSDVDLVYLAQLPESAPSAYNMREYAEELKGLYLRRAMIHAGVKIMQEAYDNKEAEATLESAGQQILSISADAQDADTESMQDISRNLLNKLDEAHNNRGSINGVATGFIDLDRKLRGMKPGQMIVIAARPACGKTTLAMNIVENAALNYGVPCGVFSLEMEKEELALRMLCSRSRVPSETVTGATTSEDQQADLKAALIQIAKAPIHIEDKGGLTVQQLAARARRMKHRHGIQLLVIDYLQLLSGRRKENRNSEMTEVSNAIKALAKELKLPIVVLSQLNRAYERDGDRKPRLSDLRESGAIEQDADCVGFLYPRKDTSAEATDLIQPVTLGILKHRSGPSGEIPLTFFKDITRFESATHHNN
jgi:replicative DNA helicase